MTKAPHDFEVLRGATLKMPAVGSQPDELLARWRQDGSGLYASGMRVQVDLAKPRGERVTSLEIAGQPYDSAKTYRLVTTDYLLEGNSGMDKLMQLRDQAAVESGVYMRDAVTEYIKEHSPLRPKLDGRWHVQGQK